MQCGAPPQHFPKLLNWQKRSLINFRHAALAIICFAIFFGSAVAKIDALLLGRKNLVLVLLSQLNEVVTAMLALVLSLTPLAVASLIAGAIATVDDYSKLLGDVGTLMASYFTTFTVQGRRLF